MRHSLPHDLSVIDGAIVLTCVQPGNDSVFLKQQYAATLNALKGNLMSLTDSAAQFNAGRRTPNFGKGVKLLNGRNVCSMLPI